MTEQPENSKVNDHKAKLQADLHGGRMLFSGPDYVRDHRVRVDPEHRYIGICKMHPDGSSEVDYMARVDPTNKPKMYRKNEMIGEIGWGISPGMAPRTDLEGVFHGFNRGIFRQASEDRATHLYQNPYSEPLDSTKLPVPIKCVKPRVEKYED